MSKTHPKTIILIPARMASTRLPGKPLADIHGVPMIVHVLHRGREAGIGEAIVATGKPVDVHTLMIQVAKADTAMQITSAVASKVATGLNSLLQTQI